MGKKQYVNLNFKDGKPEYSALVLLKADIDEKNPGDSKGQNGFFIIDPDGGNQPFKLFADHMRPVGYEKSPKHVVTAPINDQKKMEAAAYIGSGGGDKYKFKFGKLPDGSDAKSYPGDPVEVWRKVFLRAGHMKGCPSLGLGTVQPDYDPVFIELEIEGGGIEIPHEHHVRDIDKVMSKVNQGKAPPEHADQTVMVCLVDRIGTQSMLELSEQVWPAKTRMGRVRDWIQKVSGGKLKWKLPNDKLTWTDDKNWIFAVRAIMQKKGGGEDIRFIGSEYTFVSKDTKAGHFKHPEGAACVQIVIDMSVLRKQLITMMSADTEKVVLEVKLWALDSPFLGLANSMSPKLIVGTRNPITGKSIPAGAIGKTIVHELGHVFGLVPHYLPVYSDDKAEAKSPESNGKWYFAMGGLGSHCSEGASMVKGEIDGHMAMVMDGGSCIMFHAGDESNPLTFCGNCQKILKRADLMKLGLRSVWPKGWSK